MIRGTATLRWLCRIGQHWWQRALICVTWAAAAAATNSTGLILVEACCVLCFQTFCTAPGVMQRARCSIAVRAAAFLPDPAGYHCASFLACNFATACFVG